MLAWSEELITDVETRNHGYDVIVGRRAVTDYSDHPRKLIHAKPEAQINRRGRTASFHLAVGCTTASNGLKDFSPKVGTLWHYGRLRSVALYL